VNEFNPERIVVGGTVAERQGERWLEPARAEVARTALRDPARRARIVPAELGNDVGLVGAWPLVKGRHGDPVWRARRGLRLSCVRKGQPIGDPTTRSRREWRTAR